MLRNLDMAERLCMDLTEQSESGKMMGPDEDYFQWSRNRWKGDINKRVVEVGLEDWVKSMNEKTSPNM